MPITVKGSGGGGVTLDAGAAASATTLTLPNVSGTVLQSGTAVTVAQGGTGATTLTANNVLLGNGTSAVQVVAPGTSGTVLISNGTTWTTSVAPAFSAYVAAGQAISGATWTKMQAGTKEFDTNNNYDNTTNYRFTPTVAGYYQFNACWQSVSSASVTLAFYKNGSAAKAGIFSTTSVIGGPNVAASSLIYCNGSTDYVECYVYSSVSNTVFGSQVNSYFQSFFVRGT